MATQYQTISGRTLSTSAGTQADLAQIILAAKGIGAAPSTEIHVWIRHYDGDPQPWKGTSSGAVAYLTGLLAAEPTPPFISNENGRVYLVVGDQKFSLVSEGKTGILAALEDVGLPKGKAHFVAGKMFGTNGHSNGRSKAEAPKAEAPAEAAPTNQTVETLAEAPAAEATVTEEAPAA